MIFSESSKQFWLLIFHEIFNLNIRVPFKELWHMSENKTSIVFLGLVNIFRKYWTNFSSFQTSGFLMFSGGIKREHWHEMG